MIVHPKNATPKAAAANDAPKQTGCVSSTSPERAFSEKVDTLATLFKEQAEDFASHCRQPPTALSLPQGLITRRFTAEYTVLLTPNIGRDVPQMPEPSPLTLRTGDDAHSLPGFVGSEHGLQLNAAARARCKWKTDSDFYLAKEDKAYTLEFVVVPGAHRDEQKILAREPGHVLSLTSLQGEASFRRGPMGHTSLVPRTTGAGDQWDAVLFAGTLRFGHDGQLLAWTNNSGHYAPHPAMAQAVADQHLPLNRFVAHHVADAAAAKAEGNALRGKMNLAAALDHALDRLYDPETSKGRKGFPALVNAVYSEVSSSFPDASKNEVRTLIAQLLKVRGNGQ